MREREPQYPPEYDDDTPEECPVCKRSNVGSDGETPLFPEDPAFCCEACRRKYTDGEYAAVSMDDDLYVGDEEDGFYIGRSDGPDGWYVSTLIDSNTGSFCQAGIVDDGPYGSEREAALAGIGAAIEWCIENSVELDSLDAEFWLPNGMKMSPAGL